MCIKADEKLTFRIGKISRLNQLDCLNQFRHVAIDIRHQIFDIVHCLNVTRNLSFTGEMLTTTEAKKWLKTSYFTIDKNYKLR